MRQPHRRTGGRPQRPAPAARDLTVRIRELGHKGDGIADTHPSIYVPRTLAGETVQVRATGAQAELVAVDVASPDRVEAPCPYFGSCGGCAVQHMATDPYLAWKRELVVAALSARGIDVPVAPMVPATPGTRRRAVLTALPLGRTVRLGYHARASHAIVDIESCLVLTPGLVERFGAFRDIARMTAPKKGPLRMTVTETDTGVDVAIEDGLEPDPARFAALAEIMQRARIARVSLDGRAVLALAEPVVRIGKARVALPPGGFLQATAEAEEALASRVVEALSGAKRVIDLFSGAGTFALRLAETAPVLAVESDRALLNASLEAANRTDGLKAFKAEARDLFTFPVSAKELDRFDGLVFDPPRAGAADQATEIAASKVATVVAVSCNPATLARDLRILIDGGYAVESVTPVDQFLYAPHIEVVAVLTRR
ncbi:23S rRNA (uracil1939-C5)-methyltransferase [Amorphus suaedae]